MQTSAIKPMTQISAKFFASLVSDGETVSFDWTQRLNENPHDLREEIRQEHEEFLTQLEGAAIEAIATNDWSKVYGVLIDFQNEYDLHGESGLANIYNEVSADELHSPSADFPPTNELTND